MYVSLLVVFMSVMCDCNPDIGFLRPMPYRYLIVKKKHFDILANCINIGVYSPEILPLRFMIFFTSNRKSFTQKNKQFT